MTEYVWAAYDGYRDLMDEKSDPRVKNWPTMSSPFPTLALCLSYVYFVKVLGPRLMENRKPFHLRRVMMWYNFVQVIFSVTLFYQGLACGWWRDYSLRCQPIDYSNEPKAVAMVHVCWWYYFSKFTEFIDTIFFVLRKKNKHISTLHVLHHGIMPLSVWFGVKFTPGGQSTFFGLLNTFVHAIMYWYYFLAALGPKMQRYLWWKKYLTTLQMVQFLAVMIHAFQLFFIECDYPRAFTWFIGMHAIMFYFLFRHFFTEAYKIRRRPATTTNDLVEPQLSMGKKSTNPTQMPQDKLSSLRLAGLRLRQPDNTQGRDSPNAPNHSDLKGQQGQDTIYATQYRMPTTAAGYISDSGLRNRAFIDNQQTTLQD